MNYAQQNIFPGVQWDMIYEEDLEDLIVDEEIRSVLIGKETLAKV